MSWIEHITARGFASSNTSWDFQIRESMVIKTIASLLSQEKCGPTYSHDGGGFFVPLTVQEFRTIFKNTMEKVCGLSLINEHTAHYHDDGGGVLCYACHHTFVDASLSHNHIRIQVVSTDKHLFDILLEFINTYTKKTLPIVPTINLLTLDRCGNPDLTPKELPNSPLIRANYSPDVLSLYDHVAHDLQSDSPCGRIVLLEGTPGTGKTYLCRGLVSAIPQARWCLIPASLISELANPRLLPVLTDLQQENDDEDGEMKGVIRPIVLLLEDADLCLVSRGQDNISSISAVLNLGDGILNALLGDVRIVATTNAQTTEIDEALLRPGRLCRSIHIDQLSPEQATARLRELNPEIEQLIEEPCSLAEIYRLARQHSDGEIGEAAIQRPPRRLGFAPAQAVPKMRQIRKW